MGLAKMHVITPDDDAGEPRADESQQAQPQARPEELRLLEAMLFAATEPLAEKDLAARLPEDVDVRDALKHLQQDYAARGVNLVAVAGKWMFRTADDLSWLLSKETVETRKLSRAAIETLAIIAYHQPVTRAEIEDIRGVSTSKGSVDVLLQTGWIKPRGRRKAPGRPMTYGTTETFLSHFGLDAVGDLPGLDELRVWACSMAACLPASRCRCRPTTRRCATTRTRWSRAISILAWRRRKSGWRRNRTGRCLLRDRGPN